VATTTTPASRPEYRDSTVEDSGKGRALRRDPRVSLCWDDERPRGSSTSTPVQGDGDTDETSLPAPDGDHPDLSGHDAIAHAVVDALA